MPSAWEQKTEEGQLGITATTLQAKRHGVHGISTHGTASRHYVLHNLRGCAQQRAGTERSVVIATQASAMLCQ
jgi:hypothetical protein